MVDQRSHGSARALAGRHCLRDGPGPRGSDGLGREGARHPIDLPEGYHTAAQGQASSGPAPVPVAGAPPGAAA